VQTGVSLPNGRILTGRDCTDMARP
jgi:hypothetical protein